MSSSKFAPIFAGLVGVASGIYIFQPVVLQQLKKDGGLKPEYDEEERQSVERWGDLVGLKKPDGLGEAVAAGHPASQAVGETAQPPAQPPAQPRDAK